MNSMVRHWLLQLPQGGPQDSVFPTWMSNETRQRDYKRAGISLRDARGEVLDFHALRTTFGTEKAAAGVAPAKLRHLMRHKSIQTTLNYYVKLDAVDMAAEIEL